MALLLGSAVSLLLGENPFWEQRNHRDGDSGGGGLGDTELKGRAEESLSYLSPGRAKYFIHPGTSVLGAWWPLRVVYLRLRCVSAGKCAGID